MNTGLLVLRLLLSALLVGHACQKLFGWFGGSGPRATGETFEKWGFRPGTVMAVTAGLCEVLGAGSLALGLLTPGGCAVVIGTMIVAAAPNAANGIFAHLGGCEVPLVYAGLAVVLALTGPGRFSLDHALGLTGLTDAGWSIAAVGVGVVAAIPPLVRRHSTLHRSPTHV